MTEICKYPCKICGVLTPYAGTQLCDNCWEVTKRLDKFVQSPKGVWTIQEAMRKRDLKTDNPLIEAAPALLELCVTRLLPHIKSMPKPKWGETNWPALAEALEEIIKRAT
jgi:hypothetical protein